MIEPDINSLYAWIRQSAIGREHVERFDQHYRSGIIELRWLDPSDPDFKSLSRPGLRGAPAGGFQLCHGQAEIVMLRGLDPRLSAALLLHEIAHSLDGEFVHSFSVSEKLWREFKLRALQVIAGDGSLTFADLTPGLRLELVHLRARALAYDRSRLLRSERHAHAIVRQWMKQISAHHPHYADYLRAQKGFYFESTLTDDDLKRAYGL